MAGWLKAEALDRAASRCADQGVSSPRPSPHFQVGEEWPEPSHTRRDTAQGQMGPPPLSPKANVTSEPPSLAARGSSLGATRSALIPGVASQLVRSHRKEHKTSNFFLAKKSKAAETPQTPPLSPERQRGRVSCCLLIKHTGKTRVPQRRLPPLFWVGLASRF